MWTANWKHGRLKVSLFCTQRYISTWTIWVNDCFFKSCKCSLKSIPFCKGTKKNNFVLYVFLIKYLCRYLCFSRKYNSCNFGINPSTKCKLTLSTQNYVSLCGTCLCKPRFWTNKQTWKIETNKWECTINCSIF